MGFLPLDGLDPETGYQPDQDLEFFRMPETYGRILLREGNFATVSPDDGHMPRCVVDAPRRIKKIVVKVRVADTRKGA